MKKIHGEMKILIGNHYSTNNMEKDFKQLQKLWTNLHLKLNSLEEKLIERDKGTLQLTQKLEEEVLKLKEKFINEKDEVLQSNQIHIERLTDELQV